MAVTIPVAPSTDVEAALRLDFRSDTITQPTPAMREAMKGAHVGDDVFGEDPSINALEAEAARLFDKEAGLFVASGTQGNLLALLSLTRPGDELIAEAGTHIANSEVGGAARLGGLTLRPLIGHQGRISPEQVIATVRPENVHYARTTLLTITSGEAYVCGIDVARDPDAARRRIGVALQEAGLDPRQTGRELLVLQGRLFGMSPAEAAERARALLALV